MGACCLKSSSTALKMGTWPGHVGHLDKRQVSRNLSQSNPHQSLIYRRWDTWDTWDTQKTIGPMKKNFSIRAESARCIPWGEMPVRPANPHHTRPRHKRRKDELMSTPLEAIRLKCHPSKEDLIQVVDNHPDVSSWGVGGPQSWTARRNGRTPEHFEADRQSLREDVRMFQLCCQWLSLFRRRKTINLNLGTSYGLKHAVEEWSGEYIHNGAFIAAVFHLGIPYLSRADSPNIKIAISRKLVDGARTSGPDKSMLVSGPIYPSVHAGSGNGLL